MEDHFSKLMLQKAEYDACLQRAKEASEPHRQKAAEIQKSMVEEMVALRQNCRHERTISLEGTQSHHRCPPEEDHGTCTSMSGLCLLCGLSEESCDESDGYWKLSNHTSVAVTSEEFSRYYHAGPYIAIRELDLQKEKGKNP